MSDFILIEQHEDEDLVKGEFESLKEAEKSGFELLGPSDNLGMRIEFKDDVILYLC